MPAKGQFKKNATADSKRQRAYNGSEEQKKRRAERNASRREVVKKVGKAAAKGKDVDHVNHNTSDKSSSNLKLMSVSKNRAKNQHSESFKRRSKK